MISEVKTLPIHELTSVASVCRALAVGLEPDSREYLKRYVDSTFKSIQMYSAGTFSDEWKIQDFVPTWERMAYVISYVGGSLWAVDQDHQFLMDWSTGLPLPVSAKRWKLDQLLKIRGKGEEVRIELKTFDLVETINSSWQYGLHQTGAIKISISDLGLSYSRIGAKYGQGNH